MPLFFFHLRGGPDGLSLDKDGLDLLDVEAAYLEAHQTALDMAQEWLRKGRSPRGYAFEVANGAGEDRKSTRLNSSHANISYAVFCLKKKKQRTQTNRT